MKTPYREAAEMPAEEDTRERAERLRRRKRAGAIMVLALSGEGLVSLVASAVARDAHTAFTGPWVAFHVGLVAAVGVIWAVRTLIETAR